MWRFAPRLQAFRPFPVFRHSGLWPAAVAPSGKIFGVQFFGDIFFSPSLPSSTLLRPAAAVTPSGIFKLNDFLGNISYLEGGTPLEHPLEACGRSDPLGEFFSK